ncbi:MAG: hypothetical protein QGF68_12940, partial [Nitrospinota bacterium]|jgi:hypothetical protein|nr:hypothetical protein [Nitrospinota bacterium]
MAVAIGCGPRGFDLWPDARLPAEGSGIRPMGQFSCAISPHFSPTAQRVISSCSEIMSTSERIGVKSYIFTFPE